MNKIIVTARTSGGSILFFTGRSGPEWLSENEEDAFFFSEVEAQRLASQRNRQYQNIGLHFFVADRPHNYRHCLARNVGIWDLYLMDNGVIRSVPSDSARLAGHREAFYGDREHLRVLIEAGEFQQFSAFTDQGLELMAGLTCEIASRRLIFRRQ
ncbi:hypothetical protein [Pseudomonas syringae pv. coryli]|uniref:hypothetical protein n=1 Tax=Pseudomonas syringae pv. coryli TaxID=317659 RepID=UPI003D2C70A6